MLPIHYLCRLHPNLNTWFISVEDEVEDINLPRMSAIHFDLEHRIFDATHMIANFLFSPPEPALMQPIIRANPDLDPATTEHQSMCTGDDYWKPLADPLLPNCIGM